MKTESLQRNSIITFAAIVVILGAIKIAASIVVPFLLAIFIAIILAPLINFLVNKGIPHGLALTLVVILFIISIALMVIFVGASVKSFSANLSHYNEGLKHIFSSFYMLLNRVGIEIHSEDILSLLDPSIAMNYTAKFLNSMQSLLSNGFMILFLLIFMLAETQHLTRLMIEKNETSSHQIEDIMGKIKHYMALKSVISLFTGFIITLLLMIQGVDYAILWGVLAFLLNFIPNIGSFIAAIPAVLLSLVQLGFVDALITAVIFVFVNTMIGSVVEPKVMGRSLGLSSLVVFMSLIFWGWLLGLVGMFISIPLTIIVKIILDANEETQWLGDLLGSSATNR